MFDTQPVAPGSDNIFPRFYMKPVHNPFRSNAEGRPIYDDKEYVEINIGGDKNTQIDCRVTDEHRERWPTLYAKFKAGVEQAPDGTPLEQWALLSPAQVAEFKALHIYTVEAFAAVNDGQLRNMGMGARSIRDRAILFVEQAAGAEPVLKLQSALESLQGQMAVMQKTIDDQATALKSHRPVAEAAE